MFIHEKEANSIFPKSGLKHLVAVTPSIIIGIYFGVRVLEMNRLTFVHYTLSSVLVTE